MSLWVRNPQGTIITYFMERKPFGSKRRTLMGSGIILVLALIVVIGLLAVWPAHEPAALPVMAEAETEDDLISGVAGRIDGEDYLLALIANGESFQRPALTIYTVGDDGVPQRITTLQAPVDALRDDLPSAPRIAFSGTTAYIPLAGTDRSALWVVDLSNPESPAEISTIELPTEPGSAVVNGGRLAVGPMDGALVRLFDVSNLAQPQLAGEYSSGHASPTDLALVDTTLYVANTEGVQAVDVSTISDPEVVGTWASENWSGDTVRAPIDTSVRMMPVADYLYAAADIWGIDVLDVENPTDMNRPTRKLALTQLPGGTRNIDDALDVAVTGNAVFALWEGDRAGDDPDSRSYTIQEIDVSDPGDPEIDGETDEITGSGSLKSLVIVGNNVFFLNGDKVHIVSTTE